MDNSSIFLKMTLNRIYQYFKRCINACHKVSDITGNSLIYTYYDFFIATVRHGCFADQYLNGGFYKLKGFLRRKSFTQKRIEKIILQYNQRDYWHLLENKNEFNELFSTFINRKWLYSKNMEKKDLLDLCHLSKKLFVKPVNDMEGHGIRIIDTKDLNETSLIDLQNEDLVIEQFIEQHADMVFGNKSVNTIRILTFLDNNNEPHIIRAGMRVGIGESIIDNFSAGGILYGINTELGIIDHCGISKEKDDIIYHPGTEIKMIGFQIPMWERIVELAKKAALVIPQCRFIGWDIAITPEAPELIEGNQNPGLFTLECAGKPGAYFDCIKYIL